MASCLLSTAIKGGGTVLQQIRSVQVHQLCTIFSSHWSSSLSRWLASCLLSTAIRGWGIVLQQIRSVHQLFTILCARWSSSLSHGQGLVPPLYSIRGGVTVLWQIRSVHHLFTILSSHWSSSLSRGLPLASFPPPSEAGEPYYSRSGQPSAVYNSPFLLVQFIILHTPPLQLGQLVVTAKYQYYRKSSGCINCLRPSSHGAPLQFIFSSVT